MNWYKEAQHSNIFLYTSPTVDYGNNYGNNYVEPMHILSDPYYKQKQGKEDLKRKYEYFLDQKAQISKRTAVTAINRLAKAINGIVSGRRKLADAVESDEFFALRRLLKSLVVESEQDTTNKEILLESLAQIEAAAKNLRDETEEVLPHSYNNLSTFIEDWIKKRQPDPSVKRKPVLTFNDNKETRSICLK